MIIVLLTVANGCKHEETELEKPPVITTSVSDISGTVELPIIISLTDFLSVVYRI